MMNKPRIRYILNEKEWLCEDMQLDGEEWITWMVRHTFGGGSTPKEAFTDWYIKQIGKDNPELASWLF